MNSHTNIRSVDTYIKKNNNNTNLTFINVYRKKQLLTLILQQRHNYLISMHNIISDNNPNKNLYNPLSVGSSKVQNTYIDNPLNIYKNEDILTDDNSDELEITHIIIDDFIQNYNIYNSSSISSYSQDVVDNDILLDNDIVDIIEYIVDEKTYIENELLYENIYEDISTLSYEQNTSDDEVSIMTDVSSLIN